MALFAKLMKNYGKNAGRSVAQGLTDALVSLDPTGMSEAEIETIEEQFDAVNREFAVAKAEWQREQKEADDIVKLREQRMAAAELLSEDPSKEEALNKLLTSLEEMQADVDREIEEAADAKAVMNELEETVKLYADKLKTARTTMKKAASEMQKAQKQAERAKEQAERSARLQGLRSASSNVGSALAAMNRKAEEAKQEADAARRKAQLLGKSTAEEDDDVAAAMAAVSGKPIASTSAADRLAALRGR